MTAFFWSWSVVPRIEEPIYFEVLFWGGGHTLQFQHALLMVVAWLWIGSHSGSRQGVAAGAGGALLRCRLPCSPCR